MNTKETTYNGWTNYATWRVNLEFFDNYELQDYQKELSVYELSENLKEYTEYYVTEDTDNNEPCISYALAFLAQVNYYEIAQFLKEHRNETNL